MLRNGWMAACLGMVIALPAWAQQGNCPCAGGNRIATELGLAQALDNQTICAVLGNDRWQEFHQGTSPSGGDVIDWKLGPTDPVDRSKKTGTWRVLGTRGSADPSGQPRVEYNYGSGGTYTYVVCREGGNLHFCGSNFGGRNITNATTRAGQVSCN